MTKLNFLILHRRSDALKTYTELLTYTKSAVTRNYSEKTINGILDYVGGGKGGVVEVEILEKFYQATRKALEEAKNERLSVKTNLKLAKLWLDRQEYTRLAKAGAYFVYRRLTGTHLLISLSVSFTPRPQPPTMMISHSVGRNCSRFMPSKFRCTMKPEISRSLK